MKTIIHVNQHIIRSNKKTGARDPVLTVKTYKYNIKCHAVQVHGASRVVYSPDKPLACGARVWIETLMPVTAIVDPTGRLEAERPRGRIKEDTVKYIGKGDLWTIERKAGKVYVNHFTGHTVALNDPAYPSAPDFHIPDYVLRQAKRML